MAQGCIVTLTTSRSPLADPLPANIPGDAPAANGGNRIFIGTVSMVVL